jgi:uncharacterized protein YcbX
VISVTALSTAPVKGTRLHCVDTIELGFDGARGNRQFFVIDARDRMVNAKNLGQLQTIVADVEDGRLSLTFPDGRVVEAPPGSGDPLTTRFFSGTRETRIVNGPFADALTDYLGKPVQLVEPAAAGVDRGREGAVTLISRGSLAALGNAVGEDQLDARRFRMLVEIDGIPAHVEDRWIGRGVKIGDAIIRFRGHVGRCLITSRHPETGEIDLPTLDALASYRRHLDTTEPLPFGIYGEVLEEGTVRVGDPVAIVD